MAVYAADPKRYEKLPYRRCGATGLKLPPIILGGWHNFTDEHRVRELLTGAFDRGITHFDLANNYGPPPGIAETLTGQVLAGDLAAHRDELVISSKAGFTMWPGPYGDGGSRKYLLASLDASLKRLRLEYVDIFYHHRFDAETPLDESLAALEQAVRQGKALYSGLSNYGAPALAEACTKATPAHALCIYQGKYSMLTRRMEQGVLEAAARGGLGVTVFSPLEQGILAGRYLGGVPDGSRATRQSDDWLNARMKPATIERLKKIDALAKRRGQSMARLALTWVLRDPRVTCALIGASSVAQLDENLKAATDAPLSAEEQKEIEGILA